MTALSVPQHKLRCTIGFGGSVRIARVSACLRKRRASLFSRERTDRAKRSSERYLPQYISPSLLGHLPRDGHLHDSLLW